MSIRKDNNMFRVLDQQENVKRLAKRQSAYKRHLIEKLVEKGDRGKELIQNRNILSAMAMQNQIQTRSEYQQQVKNIGDIAKNYSMDINMKNLYNDKDKQK